MHFSEARNIYKQLGKQHFAGTLSRADFHAEVRKILVHDDRGRRWRIDSATGQWQHLENGEWMDASSHSDQPQLASPHKWRATSESLLHDVIPLEIVWATAAIMLVMILTAAGAYFLINFAT